MPQEIRISKNQLHLVPGGTYDMVKGNYIEFAVAKLHLLVANIEKMIEIQCDCGEVQNERTPYGTELMAIAEKFYDEKYRDLVENYSLHKIEFPKSGNYPITIPKWLEEEPWVDQSWHNDACPSFLFPFGEIIVWVYEDNPDHRDYDCKKFVVTKVDIDPETEAQEFVEQLYECDTEEELKHYIETASY